MSLLAPGLSVVFGLGPASFSGSHPDLFAAAVAWFKSDATLVEAFPGGFHLSRAGVATGFPYAKVGWNKPQPSLSVDDEPFFINFTAYALGDDAAADAGETLVKAYLDETREPLVFTDKRGNSWRESMRREQPAIGPEWVDTVESVDGGPQGRVYAYRSPIEVWVIPA